MKDISGNQIKIELFMNGECIRWLDRLFGQRQWQQWGHWRQTVSNGCNDIHKEWNYEPFVGLNKQNVDSIELIAKNSDIFTVADKYKASWAKRYGSAVIVSHCQSGSEAHRIAGLLLAPKSDSLSLLICKSLNRGTKAQIPESVRFFPEELGRKELLLGSIGAYIEIVLAVHCVSAQ